MMSFQQGDLIDFTIQNHFPQTTTQPETNSTSLVGTNSLVETIIETLTIINDELQPPVPIQPTELPKPFIIPFVSRSPAIPQAKPTPKIPTRMLDFHTKVCKECQERNNFVKELYQIPFRPETQSGEILARDQMLEDIIEECRKCFVKTNNL